MLFCSLREQLTLSNPDLDHHFRLLDRREENITHIHNMDYFVAFRHSQVFQNYLCSAGPAHSVLTFTLTH